MERSNKRIAVLFSSTILVAGLIAMTLGTSAALAATNSSVPPVNLKTDNGSAVVVVDWSPKQIQQGKATEFTINFQDPSSGASLQHTNYNLEVKDANGNTVKSLTDLHSHTGKDVQSITFDKAGNFQLVITLLGLGISMPFDTSKSGTAEASIMVE
jgi:hypothetical protein